MALPRLSEAGARREIAGYDGAVADDVEGDARRVGGQQAPADEASPTLPSHDDDAAVELLHLLCWCGPLRINTIHKKPCHEAQQPKSVMHCISVDCLFGLQRYAFFGKRQKKRGENE